jgi:hypothetical protein
MRVLIDQSSRKRNYVSQQKMLGRNSQDDFEHMTHVFRCLISKNSILDKRKEKEYKQ